MTFDMKAARQERGIRERLELLPAALDEIERQIKTIDGYANAVYSANGRIDAQAKQIEDRNLIIGHMQAAIEAQAKRIAELEGNQCYSGACSYAVNYEEDMTTYRIRIDKQRAALKKLGQAKRERGKALVEERARFIKFRCKMFYGKNEPIEKFIEHAMKELRQEKLL